MKMKTNIFDRIDPILILNFLAIFEKQCYLNEYDKRAAMWCVKQFIAKSAAASSALHLHSKSIKTSDKQEGMLALWWKLNNRLLETYTTGNVITETDMEISNSEMS